MPETRKLQNLYRAIPEEPELTPAQLEDIDNAFQNLNEEQQTLMTEIQSCQEELDSITSQVQTCISDDTEMRNKIFKHMSFYYEMKGVSSGSILLEELSGEVDIIKFEYESFPMGINVYAPKVSNQSNVHGKEKVVKSYVLPEGFAIWLEIAFKPKTQKMSSLFKE
jgi:archaellum component FlaC